MNKNIDKQQLKAICDVLADTDKGLAKSELTQISRQNGMAVVNDGSICNGKTYIYGLNKRKWLFNYFAEDINKHKSFQKIFSFIENAMNPVSYINTANRDKYNYRFEEINKVLLFIGVEITQNGTLIEAEKTQSLNEADRRVNSLKGSFTIGLFIDK